MRSLADILDVGPTPADPCEDEEDWALLDELEAAVTALAERLKHEPGFKPCGGAVVLQADCAGAEHFLSRADLADGREACRLTGASQGRAVEIA